MPRVLAPSVYYNDAQWRAIKSKANNNHPSLTAEDIEIIKEAIRVNNAILNHTDPTPLPQFQKSIRYDERQVIKYFLWSKTRECNSTFTLISTYYLPKRRPLAGGSKQKKQADEDMKPTRDPRGTTYGFVRRPKMMVNDADVNTAARSVQSEGIIGGGSEVAENGRAGSEIGSEASAMGSNLPAEQNPAGKNNPGGKKPIFRLMFKSNTSHEFARRSERVIGGAATKNVDIGMEGIGEIAMSENTSTTNELGSSRGLEDSTDSTGSMGWTESSNNSALSDEANDTSIIENDNMSENAHASPYVPLNTAYKSPFTPNAEIDDKIPNHRITFLVEEKDVSNTSDSRFMAAKSQGSNNNRNGNSNTTNTTMAKYPQEDIPSGTTNKLPHEPFSNSNSGYQLAKSDDNLTFSAADAEEGNNAQLDDMEIDGHD